MRGSAGGRQVSRAKGDWTGGAAAGGSVPFWDAGEGGHVTSMVQWGRERRQEWNGRPQKISVGLGSCWAGETEGLPSIAVGG